MKRNCFVCRKELTSAGCNAGEVDMDFSDPPNDAVCWHTTGNWGSTLIDSGPFGPDYEISICDVCLLEREDMVTWHFQDRSPPKVRRMGSGVHPPNEQLESLEYIVSTLKTEEAP